MVINVLVSADSRKSRTFIECIKNICENSGRYRWRFLPDETADLEEKDRLRRMFECLVEAHLIIMDVTPTEYTYQTPKGTETSWLTNQGVLIEYGAIMASEHLIDRLKLFSESSVKRKTLHPYFLKTVDVYSEKTANDTKDASSLRNKIIRILKDFEDRMHKEYTILRKNEVTYKNLLKIFSPSKR